MKKRNRDKMLSRPTLFYYENVATNGSRLSEDYFEVFHLWQIVACQLWEMEFE